MIFIYTTYSNENEAEKIAKILLEKKMIACANIFPIKSLYWWKGKIESSGEFVLIAKAIEDSFNMIKKEVENIHSYKIPCIIKLRIEPNEKYLCWLLNSLK